MQTGNLKAILIDGYLDEPSCLGVPPYISPHIRYTYGALLDTGIKKTNLKYITIDQLRKNWDKNIEWMEKFNLIIIIAGTTVPGKYLGGKPISLAEIKKLGQKLYYPRKVVGGPITLVKKKIEGFDHICKEIASLDLYQLLSNNSIQSDPENIAQYISKWSLKGAALIRKHPNYPYLVCEIETYRGCPRSSHCAFCSERLKKRTYQRSPEQVIREVKALAAAGSHYYRLGCQTDLLMYQGENNRPNPGVINKLYYGIREVDPNLKVLHLDNINPAGINKYQKQSRKILKTITTYNTSGDIAAFGLETADPQVIKKNNIETDPDTTLEAIKIVNEIGGKREHGIPKLLPGLNFLHGLIGERKETMEYNFQFLKKILDTGLMVRRINIRQVVTLNNYPEIKIDHEQFKTYKQKVNKEINKPMLQRVFPRGTIIENVLTETRKGKLTFGRQLGSYPILIGIPGKLKLNKFVTVRVIDHGYRSLTALPWPFKLKKASIEQLTSIPGIGKKRANKIFLNQPDNLSQLKKLLGSEFPFAKWKGWFKF